jgi:uncharacterized surface protein with fasciclin (FAS1) repeats
VDLAPSGEGVKTGSLQTVAGNQFSPLVLGDFLSKISGAEEPGPYFPEDEEGPGLGLGLGANLTLAEAEEVSSLAVNKNTGIAGLADPTGGAPKLGLASGLAEMIPAAAVVEAMEGPLRRLSQAFADCPGGSISDAVAADPAFSTLVTALEQTGLDATLSGPGPVTLLAPTDAAFDQLSEILRAGGPQAQRILSLDLKDLLEAHVVAGEVDLAPSGEGVKTGSLQTVAGNQFSVLYTPSDVVIDSSASVEQVTQACNGALARISAVLVPRVAPDPQPQPVSPTAPLDPATDPATDEDFYFDDEYFGAPEVPPEEESCQGTSECCDRRPPGQYSCAEQASWGKCAEAWMRNGLYCRATCGFCEGGTGGGGGGGGGGDFYDDGFGSPFEGEDGCADEGVLFQYFGDIRGSRISNLQRSRRFPDNPQFEVLLEGDAPVDLRRARRTVPGARWRNFGSRFCGYFCPPVTGAYRFSQIADNDGQIYLQTEEGRSPELIANFRGWARNRRQWDRNAVDRGISSRYIELEEGRPVKVEMLHKGDRNNHKYVLGVEMPNGAKVRPAPARLFSADCRRADVQEVPPPASLRDACRCSPDGFSGTVDTGRRGCFNYNIGGYFGARLGGEGGAAVGDYLEAEYGFREGTSAYMSNLWSNAFEEWSRNSRQSTTSRVCYVRHPQACPAAVESERLPGAAWRLCD